MRLSSVVLLHALLPMFAAAIVASPAVAAELPSIQIVSGVTEQGDATDLWLAVLRKRLPDSQYEAVAGVRRPLSAEENAWSGLIRAHAARWSAELPPLVELFAPAGPPDRIVVVLGNRGAEDAFTHDPTTIGFDLSALQRVYGAAADPQNALRLDRIFRHEFTHLLQKRWLPQHPWPTDTPLQAALLTIWLEGMGNYYSLSPTWLPVDGRRSAAADAALAQLEPRFVARLAALSCADAAAAGPLMAGISSGPFERKWGAIPAALWLAAEPGAADAALRRFVTDGPRGIWELADRHLPAVLAATLREVRQASEKCAG